MKAPLSSLIIATLNRPDDLMRCLRSVERVTPGFDEVIIVEQGDVRRTRRIADRFPRLKIEVAYHPVQSQSQAKSRGAERAGGHYLFFANDDIELDEDHVRRALTRFEAEPDTVGISGPIREPSRPDTRGTGTVTAAIRGWCGRTASVLLLAASSRAGGSRRSGTPPLQFTPGRDDAHDTQRLDSGHCVYRRSVFDDGFRFCPSFIRWSFGEGAMLSRPVYRHYGPGSLRFDPEFAVTHHASTEQRMDRDAAVRMMVIYRFLYWYRHVYEGSLLNLLCYLYGQIGVALIYPVDLVHSGRRWRDAATLAAAWRFLARHWRDVGEDRIDYNHFILHGAGSVPSSSIPEK